MQHVEFVNLLGKPQPINITFKGIRGELLVCLSTEHRFPTEDNSQATFLDQTFVSFATSAAARVAVPISNAESDDASFADARSGADLRATTHRFRVPSLYCSIETTERSPKVSISVTFGVLQAERALPSFNTPRSLTGAKSNSSFSQYGVELPR